MAGQQNPDLSLPSTNKKKHGASFMSHQGQENKSLSPEAAKKPEFVVLGKGQTTIPRKSTDHAKAESSRHFKVDGERQKQSNKGETASEMTYEKLQEAWTQIIQETSLRDNRSKSYMVLMGSSRHMVPTPVNSLDEVYPGIFLGDGRVAKDLPTLHRLGITHVVNAAQGTKFSQINTDEAFYNKENIQFVGIKAMDVCKYEWAASLDLTSDFIEGALTSGGAVYVHCFHGVSRSATVVLAFLIMKRGMGIVEALRTVKQKRQICPNDGFMKQLLQLHNRVHCGMK